MVYIGTYDCYEDIKIIKNFDLHLAYLNNDTIESFYYKKKIVVTLSYLFFADALLTLLMASAHFYSFEPGS